MTDLDNEYQPRLFGPGKKYKSLESLETSRERADEYITILERQLDEYRSDNSRLRERDQSRDSLEDLYDRVVTARNQPLEQPSRKTEVQSPDFEKIIEAKLEAMQRVQQQRSNLDMVKDKIRDKLGSNYQDSLKKRLETLDLTEQEADTFASTKPKTFLKMLGLEEGIERFQAPPSNSNIASTQNASQKRTWTFYQDLKKNNPTEYYKPKTNLQMLEDYQKLGTEFEDGDFARFGDSLNNR